MFKTNAIALLLTTLLFGAPVAVQAQDTQDFARAVEQHYRDLKDLKAKVVQKNFIKSLNKTQTFDGTLWIKKPGRLRLEYTNGQLIVVDGTAALFYSKKSEQVIKKRFTDFDEMNIPVAFLLGAGQLSDSFDVLKPRAEQPGRLELLPRKAGAAYRKLAISADAGGRIAQLTIYDRSGNVTEISFSDQHENAGVDEGLFRFAPPKGTEVIEQ